MQRRHHICRALHVIAAIAALVGAAPALAQTRDDFFSGDMLHELRITMSQRDWQSLKDHFNDDTYYPADLRWKGITLRNIGVRSRGHISRNGVKPGLRVDVNRYLSEQRFLGLTAFVLDNSYTDASLVRERMAMAFFNRAGVVAPREAHVRLLINEEYAGVYAIVESIDRAFLERTLGSEEAQVEQGGYLFKYRWERPYAFEYLGADLEAYAALFTPETRETDSMYSLFGRIEEMIRVINEAPDDLFAAWVGEYLDLAQFMRYLAIENFLAETDGLVGEWGLHNFYLFRTRENGRARLIPWDKDTSFQRYDHPVDFHLLDNVLTRRSIAVPELRQIYAQTLVNCAGIAAARDGSTDPRGWLEREIDRNADQVRAGVVNDVFYPFSLEQFDAEIAGLREFARRRPTVVTCALGTDDVRRTEACEARGAAGEIP